MQLFGALAVLCTIISTATSTQYGTVGYGINMFRPWCCTACFDVFSPLYLNCTTFDNTTDHHRISMREGGKMMGLNLTGASTSNTCYASNIPYQQSVSYCVKTHCNAEGISNAEQEKCFQKNVARDIPVKSLHKSLPDDPPPFELLDDATWLNSTMLVNEAHWSSYRKTIEAYEKVEVDHVTFSILCMVLGVGIPLSAGVFVRLGGHLPTEFWESNFAITLQSRFSLPALFNSHHSQCLPGRIGYLPTRPLTVFISIYIVLNVIFSTMHFNSVQPNAWFANRNQEIAGYVANRTGMLSFANMALAILFSTRNNPLGFLCGWSPTTFLTLHRWTARIAILHAFVHSLIYTIDFTWFYPGNKYDNSVTKSYFWWGVIATASMALMAGLSSLPFRARAYELFLVLHIVFALLALLGSWYHVDLRFNKEWGYEVWLYIAFAFWMYDRAIRLGKVLYYNLFSESTAEIKLVPGTKFAMLTLRIKRQWAIRPGMHTFVYFPSLGRFWENHPFTVADWGFEEFISGERNDSTLINASSASEYPQNQEMQIQQRAQQLSRRHNGFYIRCLFRIHDGTTARLYKKLSTHPLEQSHILTEGPYGGHNLSYQSLQFADKILCIAGGIGITFAAGFAKQYSSEHERRESGRRRSVDHPVVGAKPTKKMMPRCRQFTLAWTVRERSLLNLVRSEILPDLNNGGLDDGSMNYRIFLTRRQLGAGKHLNRSLSSARPREAHATVTQPEEHVSVENGQRMNVEDLLSSYMEAGKRHVVLVCGPGALADEIRRQVAQCVSRGYVVDLIEESFAW